MSDTTIIAWTEKTFNVAWGCTKISPGCQRCYADTLSQRYETRTRLWGPDSTRRTFGAKHWAEPLRWNAAAEREGTPHRVFSSSMCDIFEDHPVVIGELPKLMLLMMRTPWLDWQLLTKRPERMAAWFRDWYSGVTPEPYAVADLRGFPGYRVSTTGEVFGKRFDERMSPEVGEQGHQRVMLYRDGTSRRELIHRLVLSTFVREPKDGEQACHWDGDPGNNRLSNLRWGTPEENWRDRVAVGHGRSWSKLSPDQVVEIRARAATGTSAESLAPQYGVSGTQIRNIVRGDQWREQPEAERRGGRPLLPCWLGVSIENADYTWRADHLRAIPAHVRFVSYEPALGPLAGALNLEGLNWTIYGGESGPGFRPEGEPGDPQRWSRDMAAACQRAGVAYFHKQGAARFTERLTTLDGTTVRHYPSSWRRPGQSVAALPAPSAPKPATRPAPAALPLFPA